ncbi:MAG TPA: proline--tRNA ligase, partial [Vicinamibacterales bacterium]|nr:proline--tRNA ligase [Vicinamibacterales bacterium]
MQADFLIIGSGIAALRAAIALESAGDVLVLTKAGTRAGNTGYAQGGIAAAVGPGDSPARHLADTMAAGDGLCDERAVGVLVEEGPHYVRELLDWGAAFDRAPDGSPELALEAAHSARRVLHARDATGREIGRVLWERVSPMKNVRVIAHARATGLIVEQGRCAGVHFAQEDETRRIARANCTLLATGGAGQVFRETTNPAVATGDGVAIAYLGGAAVADLEFVQFHPTALKMEGQPRFLLSEALRGEGARLINATGEAFMMRYDPAGDLAPRDRVARGIVLESQRTHGEIFLTLDRLDPSYVHQRFPLISAACRRAGLDLATDRIPVGPAAHYAMGGVVTDLDGRTTMPGLFAAGEVACTGVHGANRLASNSLLEGLVFGARAGLAMRSGAVIPIDPSSLNGYEKGDSPSRVLKEKGIDVPVSRVQDVMWEHVGLFRDARGLQRAIQELGPEKRDEPSIHTVGRLIARAALRREESRGGHFRLDFPERDDGRWKRRILDMVELSTFANGLRRDKGLMTDNATTQKRPEQGKKQKDQTDQKDQKGSVTEITPQSENFSQWYLDVVRRAELADYTEVKGCMAIRPYGYAIWELIQQAFDKRFKATGHVNAYFPLFIPASLLNKEKEHVEGFTPQVAWVTKGGDEVLAEPLAIRPTSEVIIGTCYAKWIKSWRDLPVLINQWANVVRWEKVTRPFLRTTEFLWQEGHTAHETAEEAQEETLKILALYKECAETELAMPVVEGPKSESEKFAGASRTYSIEALMGDGRALQAGTSHNLGQNFAKAFGIQFQGRDKTVQHAWTTSWGVSTRLIGGVIMTHGDDNGLILPPRIAPFQVVIVPIPRGNWQETVLPKAKEIQASLQARGVRVFLDDRDSQTPGWKFAEWELRGVPLRMEIGPKDLEKSAVMVARRDTRTKESMPMEGLADLVASKLEEIQAALLQRARTFREEHTTRVSSYEEFKNVMEGRPGFVIAGWCGSAECEAQIKAETQATLRNIPFGGADVTGTCVKCGKPSPS